MRDSASSEGEERSNLGAREGPQASPPSPEQVVPEHDDFLIDYVHATATGPGAFELLLKGQKQYVPPPRHYRFAWGDERGTIVAWGGKRGRESMLSMGGLALARLRRDMTEADLIRTLGESRAKVTRLDIARDTSGPLTPHYVYTAFRHQRVVSEFRAVTPIGFRDEEALSINFGAPGGDIQLKVYNRAARLRDQGYEVPVTRLTRWELALRSDVASTAFFHLRLTEPVLDQATGDLRLPIEREYFRVLEPRFRILSRPKDTENRNYRSSPMAKVWRKFLKHTPGNVVVVESRQYDSKVEFSRYVEEVVRQTAAGVALLERAGGQEALQRLLERGRDRIKPVHSAMVREDPEHTRRAVYGALGMKVPQTGGEHGNA